MNRTSRQCEADAFMWWKRGAMIALWSAVSTSSLAAQCVASPTDYPIRPIRLVVPWPAGGGADIVSHR